MTHPCWSQDAYIKAWNIASEFHAGQTFGGPMDGQKIEYLNHVGRVAMEVIWAIGNTPGLNGNLAVQCAILHDTLEDTNCCYELLLTEFGEAVANGVLALTKDDRLPGKQAQMADSLQRLSKQPIEVQLVKLADRITNLSPPPSYWTVDKCARYRDEAILILQALGTSSSCLATRLQQRIEAYDQYTR